MLILAGKQGLGKSTLHDKMSKGWFNDNIRTFEGKRGKRTAARRVAGRNKRITRLQKKRCR